MPASICWREPFLTCYWREGQSLEDLSGVVFFAVAVSTVWILSSRVNFSCGRKGNVVPSFQGRIQIISEFGYETRVFIAIAVSKASLSQVPMLYIKGTREENLSLYSTLYRSSVEALSKPCRSLSNPVGPNLEETIGACHNGLKRRWK